MESDDDDDDDDWACFFFRTSLCSIKYVVVKTLIENPLPKPKGPITQFG